eukprot:TRINITY_DN1643_c0_g1::TRINITY_DN1643_c0_g1_i2::g.17785::m.17785 TRINITY_DN1643_c0_g1::TRINITY_DN1643_c0_g1_i2::g.17785  ORF type:complete len:277 (-),score=13.20,sp/Q9SIT1/TMK3_ARATH/28.91/2e-16,sp/Q9SIT1/TMK3_ARATH/32.79/7e-07,LRR_8/PF13855.1/0.0056,LRR_8/PF13855.1/3.8e+03,LRR_8/PF13855.1/1e-05,LRR_4/PF12799.2/0.018,LRR_4/PF12799.2/0.015,LRR_4/PF12799.2/0.59,LRR_4/PF12799.2/1.4e-05,LRR_1/PF00560.28/0.068,LRR_1/PF00560.28/5.4e+03,LRR_1/PF00560.28/0.83,LRR_1/PF00560.28/0.11,LRR_6/PF13516.1/0.39,L
MASLVELYLQNNQLTGTFPSSLGSKASLRYLYIKQSGTYLSCDSLATLRPLGFTDARSSPCACYDAVASSHFECFASILEDFYNATKGGQSWTGTNWLSTALSICTWEGITCNSSAPIMISLGSKGLNGTIPPSLATISSLQTLNFSKNYLHGSIPASFIRFTSLRALDLRQNQLSGSLPSELIALSTLQTMYIEQSGTSLSCDNLALSNMSVSSDAHSTPCACFDSVTSSHVECTTRILTDFYNATDGGTSWTGVKCPSPTVPVCEW